MQAHNNLLEGKGVPVMLLSGPRVLPPPSPSIASVIFKVGTTFNPNARAPLRWTPKPYTLKPRLGSPDPPKP